MNATNAALLRELPLADARIKRARMVKAMKLTRQLRALEITTPAELALFSPKAKLAVCHLAGVNPASDATWALVNQYLEDGTR